MSAPAPVSRTRIVVAHVLVVLGAIIAAVALAAGYVRWQLFDQGTFEDTASALIADDAIRGEVATSLVDQLFSNVDVQAELDQRLPERQKYLAGPLAAGARQVADRTARSCSSGRGSSASGRSRRPEPRSSSSACSTTTSPQCRPRAATSSST